MTKKEIKKPNKTSQPFGAIIEMKDNKRKLRLNSPIFFQAQLEQFPLNTKLTLWFDTKMPTRSTQQNRYYFLYLGIISQETGEEVEILHLFFKGKFLSQGITEIFGHKVRKVKSTSKLNKSEFCEYLQRIENLTDIPLPPTEEFSPTTYFGSEPLQNYPKNDLGDTSF